MLRSEGVIQFGGRIQPAKQVFCQIAVEFHSMVSTAKDDIGGSSCPPK